MTASTGCSIKNAQSFTHNKLGTVCHKMKVFAQKMFSTDKCLPVNTKFVWMG